MDTSAQPRRILLLGAELLGGVLAGLAFGLTLGFLGARLFVGGAGGFGDLIGALLGMLLGYVLGASLGVFSMGRRLGARGSYWLSLLGSVLGAALVLLLAEPLRLNTNTTLLQTLLALAVPLLATLGYNAGALRRGG